MSDIKNLSGFVWSIAEILRGDFKQSEYGKVILPFVVLRRLDCILQDSKQAVLEAEKSLPESADDATRDMILFGAVGGNVKVYNLSRFTFDSLKGQDPGQLHQNLIDYITKFSPNVRDIFLDKFRFTDQLKRLKDGGILWNVFERFSEIDLHPDTISNLEMGYLFEELIRRFSEMSNETAGEHFTPREVIRLIVDLLIANDDAQLTGRGIIRQVYDPACGTGGMLALAEEALKEFNPSIRVELFGQELNDESYGICKSDMLVTGHDPEQIAYGNTLSGDEHAGKKFHYMLSNPPFGVDWKKYQDPIKAEAENMGFEGRFGAGTPRVSDGQLLFLQHMISKMRDDETGSRIGIVMNGSPLNTGYAESSESEIRRWMLENDWVEAIISLPTDLFYNTNIQTYVWILTNRKPPALAKKVQLIDASGPRFWSPLRKSLGKKKKEIPDSARAEIVTLYASFLNGEVVQSDVSKIFDVSDFGYREIRVEQPLRLNFCVNERRIDRLFKEKVFQKLEDDLKHNILAALKQLQGQLFLNRSSFVDQLDQALALAGVNISASIKKSIVNSLSERDESADICTGPKGQPEPDPALRQFESVPLKMDLQDYLTREIQPFLSHFWIDESYIDKKDREVGKIGYSINFNKYFFEIDADKEFDHLNDEMARFRNDLEELVSRANSIFGAGILDQRKEPLSDEQEAVVRERVKVPNFANWDWLRARYLFRETTDKADKEAVFLTASQEYGVIPQQEYIEKAGASVVQSEAAPTDFKRVNAGDFVISLRTFEGGIELAKASGCISPAYTVLIPNKLIDRKYFSYLLKSRIFLSVLSTIVSGIRDGKSVKFRDFSDMGLPIPPIEEQREIASKLEQFDTLLRSFERTLDEFRSIRSGVIDGTVSGSIRIDADSLVDSQDGELRVGDVYS